MKISCDERAILILDGEFDIVAVFQQLLKNEGFHVFGFTNPLLAVEHFQINCKLYGLVISDILLPIMNGYEFIKKVKEIKPELKVFFMIAFEIDDFEFRSVLPISKQMNSYRNRFQLTI